jgi:aminopeptidase N
LQLKRVVALILFSLGLAASMVASSAAKPQPKPDLAVKRVSSTPASAIAGDTLEVSGTVANRGRRAATPRVKVLLRDAPNGTDIAELANQRIGQVPARGRTQFAISAMLPAGEGALAPAGYAVVACVKRRGSGGPFKCDASGSNLELTAVEEPQPEPEPEPEPEPDPVPDPPDFQPGARSTGDSLFPQIGNGGYDARHYGIELLYDPAANVFEAGTKTTMRAVATHDLSEFSLDFQQLDVSGVLVNGEPAQFTQEEAEPELISSIGVTDATQPSKLTVIPAEGIVEGDAFEVEVAYSGEPELWVDVDEALEGWVPACWTVAAVETCDGNYVVGEPLGSQGWFPSNNIPDDKAAFDTSITVPVALQAVGVGELEGGAPTVNGDGTHTWNWTEDDEISTYLVTASNGTAAFTQDSVALAGGSLPIYNFVDSTNPATVPTTEANLRRGRGQLQFLEEAFGLYPFDSSGAWVDRTTGIGYALEVATKSHYPGNATGATVNVSTELHELSHQWFGNTVTNEDWADLWFNEGWAQWSTWYWSYEDNAGTVSPAQQFDNNYASGPAEKWEIPPATLNGDPVNMFFDPFPTYTRGAMTLQGYREIIGESAFLEFAKALAAEFAYDNISSEEFVDFALDFSGFSGAELTLLEDYFEQWLYGDVQPTILPEDFPG